MRFITDIANEFRFLMAIPLSSSEPTINPIQQLPQPIPGIDESLLRDGAGFGGVGRG